MARYIIEERFVFKPGCLRSLIWDVKTQHRLTWKKLAILLGVSEFTVRVDWAGERTSIPQSRALKLLKLHKPSAHADLKKLIDYQLPRNWGQIRGGHNSAHRPELTFPRKPSKELAEFVGIMLGDGHLSNVGIEISLEYPLEANYVKYNQNLIRKLFGIEPVARFKDKETVLYVIVNSKSLVSYLTSLGLRVGNKIKNGATIPPFIIHDKCLLRACIRGLIDTDGGIFNKQKGYKRSLIEFKNFSKPLLGDVTKGLKQLGFTTSKSGPNAVRIQNQDDVKRYFEEIGSSNPKNIIRFRHYADLKGVPSRQDLFKLLAPKNSRARGLVAGSEAQGG